MSNEMKYYIGVSESKQCIGWMTDCIVMTKLRRQDEHGEYKEPMCYGCLKKETEFYNKREES